MYQCGTPASSSMSSFILLFFQFQGTLEFIQPDSKFHVQKPGHGINATVIDYDIFGHGGMIFWLSSSLFFFIVSNIVHFVDIYFK
jgi:hypothetical protein